MKIQRIKYFSGYAEASPSGVSYYGANLSSGIIKPVDDVLGKIESSELSKTSGTVKKQSHRWRTITSSLRKLLKEKRDD